MGSVKMFPANNSNSFLHTGSAVMYKSKDNPVEYNVGSVLKLNFADAVAFMRRHRIRNPTCDGLDGK
jgi:hypothetical protein